MNFDWNAVGAISAGASVLAALGALFYQVASLRRSIQSSTYQEIVRMFDEFSRSLVERPDIERAIFARAGDSNDTSSQHHARIDWTIAILFDWFESIVIQRKRYKAIPKEIYSHYLGVLKDTLSRPIILEYWKQNGRFYHPDLQEEAARILESLPESSTAVTAESRDEKKVGANAGAL